MIEKIKIKFFDSIYGLVVFFVIVFLFSLIWFYTNNFVNNKIENEFFIVSEKVSTNIEDRISIYINALSAIKAFHEISDSVDRSKWAKYIQSQNLYGEHPGIKALEYVEVVNQEDKDNFIKKVRQDGFPNFDIKSSDNKSQYYVVNYIEPMSGNETDFGVDLASGQYNIEALEKARDTNKFSTIKPIISNDKLVLFSAVLPIYKKGEPINTLQERRDNLVGFVMMVVDVDSFFNNVINDKMSSDLDFVLLDDQEVFYKSNSIIDLNYLGNQSLEFNSTIFIGGRVWQFKAYPTEQFLSSFETEKFLPPTILISGIVIGILLFLTFYYVVRSKRLASRIAIEMTEKFHQEKIKVEKINLNLEKALKSVESSLSEREDQQLAILNILEDVEFEKNRTEIIANDLKKYELAFENASEQMVITDAEGVIIRANNALERITGFKVKDALGKKAGSSELWGGKMDEEFYKKMWKTIKVDKKTFSGELINHHKNGVDYNALASISPVLNNKGEVLYFVGIERDITREREIDKMKTEFVSVASHQLRTPLTAIRWYVEEIYNGELGKLNANQKDYLKQILDSNERMIRLVNDLLNVSRLETGRVTVEPAPTNLIDLIDEVVRESSILAQAKNCKLEFVQPKTKLADIKLDKSLIRQVVNNLISNAIKYSKAGGGESLVLIKLSKIAPNVIISVKDNGIGIPKDHQHRIFDKFFRADNAVKSETEGTGLGLYIAKMVVEASGGKIWFESNSQGTTFTFTLPLSGSKEHKGEKSLA